VTVTVSPLTTLESLVEVLMLETFKLEMLVSTPLVSNDESNDEAVVSHSDPVTVSESD
jgi:hypothetical protein